MARKIETTKLSRLVSIIRDVFSRVSDHRKTIAGALKHKISDTLIAGLAMMFFQEPSMFEFQRRLEERRGDNNLKTIFGVEEVPKTSQFGRILDDVSPEDVQGSFKTVLAEFQKTRLWPNYRVLGGRYAVLFDGFEYFRNNKVKCEHCLRFEHKDGRIDYAHQVLAASIAHPTAKLPLPLMLEAIRREDGQEKQDCEYNAARRLIPKLIKTYPHLDMVFVGDGLFSNVPMVQLLKERGASYILVAKPGNHKSLERELTGLRLSGGMKSWEYKSKDGHHHKYEWTKSVEIAASSETSSNWFSYNHILPNGKSKYRCSWITDLEPTRGNIQDLVKVGRDRWQIENQTFDVLKNHGYNLEHNFGHGKNNLSFIYVILNFLAYMLHQIITQTDQLVQCAISYVGSRYKLWNDIRVLIKHFVWANWEVILEHILDYRDDTGFDTG
ncbi:MAG: hypothetical protein DDT31_01939 [Syntrophomonadaceae bacterium]|nr:hypothetical protein [Bacillota bacterium]